MMQRMQERGKIFDVEFHVYACAYKLNVHLCIELLDLTILFKFSFVLKFNTFNCKLKWCLSIKTCIL